MRLTGASTEEADAAMRMADVGEEEFEAALRVARDAGDLSLAGVLRALGR